MTYEEAVAFLDDRIRFGMRPGTERIAALMEALAFPQREYPSIHVSGTNGKFSVAIMVTRLLTELGLSVGTYTSPHLEELTERVAVGGEPISPEDFAGVVEYLLPYIELVESQREDELTYFELLTAVAFEWFFDRAVHAAVLEVGLGGEWDATNVADAGVSVVTKVARDHLAEFGDDPKKAAWEKAGIVKEGGVLITGVDQPELLEIVTGRAEAKGAAVVRLGHEIQIADRQQAVGGQLVDIQTGHGSYGGVFLPLFGPHQVANAALALAAVEAFTETALDLDAVRAAFEDVRIPGRLEIASRRPLVILDGGHNPDSAAAVIGTLVEAFAYERIICVLGMLTDKLIEDVAGLLARGCERFVVTAPETPRAAGVDRLRSALEGVGVPADSIEVVDGVAEATARALAQALEEDLVLVFGSLYTAGEARSWLRSEGALLHP